MVHVSTFIIQFIKKDFQIDVIDGDRLGHWVFPVMLPQLRCWGQVSSDTSDEDGVRSHHNLSAKEHFQVMKFFPWLTSLVLMLEFGLDHCDAMRKYFK